MYAGFPKLPVTETHPTIDFEYEEKNENGCVMRTEFSVPKTVNVTFPALCALLYNARSATSSVNIFGDVMGLQIGDDVTITDLRLQPRIDMDRNENISEEESRERLRKEREMLQSDLKAFNEAYAKEQLDTNAIGQFVVASARFNPYSIKTMTKLRELHDQSLPAVLLTYDPFRTSLLGRPYIRAFTPTEAYYKYDALVSKERGYQRRRGLAGYAKESGITKHGALHEIPVKIDVDAFHKLNLMHMQTSPLSDTFVAIEGLAVGNYVEALLSSIRSNIEEVKKKLDYEGNAKDNAAVPVGQDAETMLLIKHLREQTDHLDALCDSTLLYSSILRDL